MKIRWYKEKCNNIFALNDHLESKEEVEIPLSTYIVMPILPFSIRMTFDVSLAANNTLIIFLNPHNRSLEAYIKLTIRIL